MLHGEAPFITLSASTLTLSLRLPERQTSFAVRRFSSDRTVPDSVSKATYKLYGKSAAVTEFREFPDRGHSLTVDSGWREVAQAALDWLANQGIPGSR